MPRSMHLYTLIYPNLNCISDLFKMYMKSLDTFILASRNSIESRATRHLAVSAFTETVEFLERSLASMLMRYYCSMIGWGFICGVFFALCFEINVFYFTYLDKLFLKNKKFPLN